MDPADNYHLSFQTSQCRIQFSDSHFRLPHSHFQLQNIPVIPNQVNRMYNQMKIRAVCFLSTQNAEPLAQIWIRCECLYSNVHNGLTSPRRIQSSRARAGLNHATYELSIRYHPIFQTDFNGGQRVCQGAVGCYDNSSLPFPVQFGQ
jgi:hypothetical protein